MRRFVVFLLLFVCVQYYAYTQGATDIHMISIPGRSFKMSATEVTIGQYLAFCKATNSHWPEWLEKGSNYNINTGRSDHYKKAGMSERNTNHPITGVSALDAEAFCNWLGYRLPTEEEWEYAAEGGESYEYAGSDVIGDVAWFNGNSGGRIHLVGQKKANGYGLYDMSGNVLEWTGSKEGARRVYRGGGWLLNARYCRSAYRTGSTPGARRGNIGFRVVSPK